MKKYFTFSFLCLCLFFHIIEALTVFPDDANSIAEKIWKNECRGTVEGLTCWNQGENFASMGIGHFIWFTKQKEERFQEMFPELLKFLEKEKAHIPEWLKTTDCCPWNSREEFYSDFQSKKMLDLRQFLYDTKDLQAIFIAKRLEQVLPEILNNCSDKEKQRLKENFYSLCKSAKGLYALIDYLNFKGAGTSSKEAYNGKGWGLQQVLLCLPPNSSDPLLEFVTAAKSILSDRVNNAPKDRDEKRWLEGWFNRLDTYLL